MVRMTAIRPKNFPRRLAAGALLFALLAVQMPAAALAAAPTAPPASLSNFVGPMPGGPATTSTNSTVSSVAPGQLASARGQSLVRLPDMKFTQSPKKLSSALEIVLLLSLLTLAPSILLMTTSFTRIVIVFSLLRQALGTSQLPPNQVLIGLALFMTFMVMTPTWQRIDHRALAPYQAGKISQGQAFGQAVEAMRTFMIKQIVAAHDQSDVYMFNRFSTHETTPPKTWQQVSTLCVVPAYILSELKVAFIIGFRIYLPFLIIDMVVSSMLISLGMQLLPPVMVSLPLKLLLFVLVNGWHLVAATLLRSFR